MEVSFQIVSSYIGASVSLMLGSIPGAAYTIKALYIGAGSAIKWVVGLGPSWIQNSSTDFYCD